MLFPYWLIFGMICQLFPLSCLDWRNALAYISCHGTLCLDTENQMDAIIFASIMSPLYVALIVWFNR